MHGPLSIEPFTESMFQENAFLLWNRGAPDAWIIDPGMSPQGANLAKAARARQLAPQAILLTHCHADHIADIGALCQEFPDLAIWVPRGEEHMLLDPAANLSAPFGFSVVCPAASRVLVPGEVLPLGSLSWQVLDVSGHSPGGVAYYCPEASVVFTGDALFAGSIGRYDFPGSSGKRLLENIRRHLLTLPDDTVVYPGHGPVTSIGEERETNPFLDEDAD